MRIFNKLPVLMARRSKTTIKTQHGAVSAAVSVVAVGAVAFLIAAPARAAFGVENFHFTAANSADPTDTQLAANPADLSTQAGAHPYEVSTRITFNNHLGEVNGQPTPTPDADVKNTDITLPAGLIGNPRALPQCPLNRLDPPGASPPCPSATQVGMADVFGGLGSLQGGPVPLYNLQPETGQAAEFGFIASGGTPVVLYAAVGPAPTYALHVSKLAIPQLNIIGVTITFWGTPADPSHDALRGGPAGVAALPFLSNPSDCSAASLPAALTINSWQEPDVFVSVPSVGPPVTGCDRLQFNPSLSLAPESSQADSPSGYRVDLQVPQTKEQSQLATPPLKAITVTLPPGVAISPSSADGLQACADAQIDLATTAPASCPLASQIGTVTLTTPLLDHPLPGQIYLGTPRCAPCSDADAAAGRLIRLYIQVDDPVSGVVVKIPGTVSVDPTTGQLSASFPNNPQLPFSDLQADFLSGPLATLANPERCGTYTTTSQLTPWSTPYTPDATPSSSFAVSSGADGAPCAASPAALPFAPSFSAGTTNVLANEFSPLTLTFGRTDGQQTLAQISTQLPPGLLGMISTVPLCDEPQASQGTCDTASLIGHATVAAGPGPQPFHVQGSVYLTGPYNGEPFGLSVVVPAIAGPFNLGNVIVRAAINIDPHDAHATVTSDPFPQILDGIPLRIQSVNVTIDRPGFIFNPTNCSRQRITAAIASGQGATAEVSSPFEAGGCKGLAFSPKMTATLAGHSSKKNGAGLKVKIVEGVAGEANVHSVRVELPKQLPSRLTTLQKACTADVFEANPAGCPTASVVGTATATTPVLPVPLSGPAMLVSHGGEAFPDLVIVLQGDGVTIELVGNTDIKKGITSSTFATVPDAPVIAFELNLPTGPFSILGANLPASRSYNFCASKLAMPTKIVAQNGAEIKRSTKITITGCPKAKSAGKKKPTAKRSSHKHSGKDAATRSATTSRRAN